MKILAILQNQWFNEPEKVRKMYERSPEIRNDLIKRFLFMGCLPGQKGCVTGKRLYRAFGELRESITWEEASPEIGGQSSSHFRADHEHIRKAIEQHQPDIILAFGRESSTAVRALWNGVAIYCPHPAAHYADIEARLRAGASALREAMMEVSAV